VAGSLAVKRIRRPIAVPTDRSVNVLAQHYRYKHTNDIMYSSVVAEENSEETSSNFTDSVSVASSKRRFGRKRINSELSEPLTATSIVDEELGSNSQAGDPYFVFRKDLQKKLELVDESLADFLRIVHETVRSVV